MAENEVYIKGYDPNLMDDWNKEATQKQVLTALQNSNTLDQSVIKFLAKIANGQKIMQGEVKSAMQLQQQANNISRKQESQTKKGQQKSEDASRKQMSIMDAMLNLQKEEFAFNKKEAMEARRKRKAQLEAGGMSSNAADLKVKLEEMQKNIGEHSATAGTALGAFAAAVAGYNSFIFTAAEERFNFAQELRQSGLAAGLDSASASLTGFAQTVRDNNFTLGEAQKFTQQFAKTVGVMGVNASLEFASNMAYGGAEGANMMRRFGMEFGEVADVAGTYLESVRGLGMLDRMSETELRGGMEDFMTTVVTASNVMKINMTDAAQMIKETLQRTDIGSLLATMDPSSARQVQEVVGLAGGMNNQLGEALAMRLSAGSAQEFQMTDQYMAMMADPITASIAPLVETLAQATERGGVLEFQSALANIGPQIDQIVSGARNSRELLLTGEQGAQQMVASLAQLRQTVNDADKGFTAISDDDAAVVDRFTVQRQFQLMQEGIQNQFVESADVAKNLTKVNESYANLAVSVEAVGTTAGTLSGTVSNITSSLEGFAVSAGTAATNLAAQALRLAPGDQQSVIDSVKVQNSQMLETIGAQNELVSTTVKEAQNALKDTVVKQNEETGEIVVEYNKILQDSIKETGLTLKALSGLENHSGDVRMETIDERDARVLSSIIQGQNRKLNASLTGSFATGTFSEMDMARGDSDLHSQFTAFRQQEYDKLIAEGKSENHAELRANNAARIQFMDQINAGGYGNLSLETPDTPYDMNHMSGEFVKTIRDELLRNDSGLFGEQTGDTRFIDGGEAKALMTALGIGVNDQTFDLDSQESINQLALVKETIEDLAKNNILEEGQLERLITALEKQQGSLSGNWFDGRGKAGDAREENELSLLISELRTFVSSMNNGGG